MRKVISVLFLVIILVLFQVSEVMAHPGRTDSNGGHTCLTNCEKWGYKYGEYHYHNGGSSSSGGSGSSSTTTPQAVPPKPAYSQADVDEGSAAGKDQGYQDGYDAAEASATTTSGNESYQLGYEQGYMEGFKAGQEEKMKEDQEEGTNDGQKSGKKDVIAGHDEDPVEQSDQSPAYNEAYVVAYKEAYAQESLRQLVKEKGFEQGYEHSDIAVPIDYQDNKELEDLFASAYDDGYSKRTVEEKIKHGDLGYEAGLALETIDSIELDDDLYADAFNEGYERGLSERQEDAMQAGYYGAYLVDDQEEVKKYQSELLKDFYSKGYQSNKIAKEIRDTAYDIGYESEDYVIDDEFTDTKEAIALYDGLFKEGQAQSEEDSRQTLVYVFGAGLPIVAGTTVGGWMWRKKKKKKVG
ncbi:YHYH domain-containing protein [Alkalicoccobacillus gibsonii]|uniref:YHYH domain-containing protein n=1 Tax=Alkalicoccobacillus gibsonii TaxID=79881 RepID=UPI003F7C11DA